MNISVSSPTATAYSGAAGAITGIVLWVLSTYVFRNGGVPAPLEGACWVLIPGAVGYISSLLTRKNTSATTVSPAAPADDHAVP